MDDSLERREFFKSIVRNGLLLGLTGLCVTLFRPRADGPECVYAGPCCRCPIAEECSLPQTKDNTR